MDIDIENVRMCRAHPLDTSYVLNKIYTTLAASAYFNNESETGKKAITYYTGEGEEFLSTALADLPVRIIVMSDGKTLDMLVAESGIKNWLTSRTVARHDSDQKDSIDESAPFIVCGR